jgi:hypothetical protein
VLCCHHWSLHVDGQEYVAACFDLQPSLLLQVMYLMLGHKQFFVLLLLQRSFLPGGIILQGVLLLQVLWAFFCVPLQLGANWGYWPSLRPGRRSPSQASHVSHLDGVFDLPLALEPGTRNLGFTSHSKDESNRSKETCSGLQANVAVTGIEPTTFPIMSPTP